MYTLLMYAPFADEGFKRTMVCNNSLAFSSIFLGSKETFATDEWMIPYLSTLKSILPALVSVTALPISIVTVPVLGFGIKPRGPNTLPKAPTLPITDGMV